jgi:hypothetical protein
MGDQRTVFLRRRGGELDSISNAKAINGTARARVFGRFGKLQRKHTGAAALVSACFALGVYTAGADGNGPATRFADSFNDVLFVGIAGALINNAFLENTLAGGGLRENTLVDTGATFEPTDRLVDSGQQAAE